MTNATRKAETMETTTAKKANRGYLLRAAKKGQLFVKCAFDLTDDYAWDAANNDGRMDEFAQVYLRPEHTSPLADKIDQMDAAGATHEQVEPFRVDLSHERHAHTTEHQEKARGMVTMRAWDFRTQSGHCFETVASGSFSIHSNLNYGYEIRS